MCFSQCARFGHVLSRNVFSSTAESQMQIDHQMIFSFASLFSKHINRGEKKLCRK